MCFLQKKVLIPITWILLVVILLSGCGDKPTPELTAEWTLTPAVLGGTSSPLPSFTAEPQNLIPSSTAAGSLLTQDPTNLPPVIIAQPTMVEVTEKPVTNMKGKRVLPATIQISEPGPWSKLSSPIILNTMFYPGNGGQVLIQLIGEDGRMMAERLTTVSVPSTGGVAFTTKIPFEVTTAGEAALIVVSTRDGFGRRIAQAAVPVLLLQLGVTDLEPAGFDKEPFILDKPFYASVSKNGNVHIEGYMHAFTNGPIVGELITSKGGIIASTLVEISADALKQDYVPFTMDIPYTVSQRTQVRLTLRQKDVRWSELDVSLKSLIIYLDP